MPPYERELEVAIAAVQAAGRLTLEYFRGDIEVERKADASPVTIADRRAEELLRATLAREFPEDGILGEEFGTLPGRSGRRWIIDPIDGTQSFIRGVPLYGVLLGLEDRGRCVVGAAGVSGARRDLLGGAGYAAHFSTARRSASRRSPASPTRPC